MDFTVCGLTPDNKRFCHTVVSVSAYEAEQCIRTTFGCGVRIAATFSGALKPVELLQQYDYDECQTDSNEYAPSSCEMPIDDACAVCEQ